LGVEFDPANAAEIDYTAFSMRRALRDLESRSATLTVLLFDAAYEEAAVRRRYPQPGLSPLTPSRPGVFLGFSAAPNQPVDAPAGAAVGRYARALVETLTTPGINLAQAFTLVKRRVNEASGGLQVPAEMSTVVADFRFNPKAEDQVAWERAQAGSAEDLKIFLQEFPRSPHTAEARRRLAALELRNQSAGNRKLAEDAINEYRLAFEQRDLERLKSVWPSLSRQDLMSFQEFFRLARSVSLTLAPVRDPELTPDSALWVWRRKIEATDERGRMPTQENEITFRLKRSGSGMVIDSIAVKRH
jgi:hypothetical protein